MRILLRHLIYLSSFTSDIDYFDFWETPPPLAYLLIDAIRSVYGGRYVDYTERSQIAFLKDIPWYSYEGEEELLTDREKITDEHIIKNWRWVAIENNLLIACIALLREKQKA